MSKYKITAIKHLLKNNKIAKAGDEVDGKSFINLQDSLDRKFCKKVKGSEKDESDTEEVELTEKEKTVKHLKTLNKSDLQEWAKDNEFLLDESLNKKPLLADLIAQVEKDDLED